jgi:hypothetical protein
MEGSNAKRNPTSEYATEEFRWRGLYKIGGVSAIIIAFILIGEIVAYSMLPRLNTTIETFELFHSNCLAGLLTFDLLGILSYLLFIPMILSLYVALRQTNESIMIIGTVLFFIGITVFFATNTAFSMLSLSNQYAIAKTEEEKSILLAAGQTMITLFNVNAFLVSYVIVSASWIMIAYVMLQSNLFGQISSYAGILAGSAGIIAEVLENTSTALLSVAIIFYFAAIVFLFIWVILSGQRIYKMSGNWHKGNIQT